MDLRQLEYFQSVGRLNSITKTARHFHIAQPSVTIAIQKLEEELGVQLLDRSQRQIVLTTEGQAFLQKIDDILLRLREAVQEMEDYHLLQKGSIKIGITPIVGAFFFPSLFARFQKRFPQFEFSFIEEGSLAIRRRLEQGELDIGIIITSDVPARLATVPIAVGEILVCLPPRHPLSEYQKIPFAELENYPFILFREDTYFRKVIVEEATKYHFAPKIVFSSRQIETILGLVEQDVGIAFLLDAIVKKHTNVIYRPLAVPLFVQAGLAWNPARYVSRATRAFIEFAAKQGF